MQSEVRLERVGETGHMASHCPLSGIVFILKVVEMPLDSLREVEFNHSVKNSSLHGVDMN